MHIRGLLLSLIIISQSVESKIVRLTDGSRIFGDIIKVYNDHITLKTEFAGILNIPLVHVDSYSTGPSKNIEYNNHDTMKGQVKYTMEQSVIQETTKIIDPLDEDKFSFRNISEPLVTKEIIAVWSLEDNHPSYFKPISPWTYKIYLNLAKQTGNSHKEDYKGGGSAKWEKDKVTLLTYGAFDLGTNNKRNNDEEYVIGSDYERPNSFQAPGAWFTRMRWEKDRFEDIQNRIDLAGGLGYYFLDDDKHVLRSRLGLALRHEEYRLEKEKNNTDHGLELELSAKRKHKKWGTIYSKVRYNPSVEDFNQFIITQESGYEIPFAMNEDLKLSLNMGMDQEYTSHPTGNRSKDDTKYFLRLGLTF